MPEEETAESGVVASARRLGSSLLGLLRTRLELLGVELQEEKLRAVNLLLAFTVVLALALAAILLALGTLALFLWQSAGYLGLIGLTLGVGLAATLAFFWVRRSVTRGPQPFAATVAEFRKDFDSLQPPHE